uniref:Uncharacterized protein n=1 Tax=Arundo donax TaxID=35708 RepID=A0A0A8Y4I8_ARUDO
MFCLDDCTVKSSFLQPNVVTF